MESGCIKGITPDVISYNATLSSLLRDPSTEGWGTALGLLNRMKSRGIQPESRTYSILMKLSRKAGHIEEAAKLIPILLREGKTPDVIAFNSLAMAHVSQQNYEKALEIMEVLLRKRAQLDRRSYEVYFRGLAGMNRDKDLHREAWKLFGKNLPFSPEALDLMISSMVYVGRIDKAMEIMSRIHKEKAIKPTMHTFSECLTAASYATNVPAAVRLRQEMKKWDLTPTRDVYLTIIKLCLRAKDHKAGLMILETMRQDAIPFNLYFYNVKMKFLLHDRQSDACRAVPDEMT